jgi:hypothetical protein
MLSGALHSPDRQCIRATDPTSHTRAGRRLGNVAEGGVEPHVNPAYETGEVPDRPAIVSALLGWRAIQQRSDKCIAHHIGLAAGTNATEKISL